MEVLDLTFSRRSIRKFSDEPVSTAQIDLLLQAAMAATTQPGTYSIWRAGDQAGATSPAG